MSEAKMDTETALSTVVNRMKATDLAVTYCIARDAVEGASVDDDDYTVDILETTTDSLRTVLVETLGWTEASLDELYVHWTEGRKIVNRKYAV